MTGSSRPIAIIGATGQQGGAVTDALLQAGAPVRALVRNPDSASVRSLRARGIEVVAADQENAASLEHALRGVAALFFLTTFDGADGTQGEVRRGVAVADAAARTQVPLVVYSSVGGAERNTGIPHFESKRLVEQRLGRVPQAKILRPTFFMENLAPQLTGDEGPLVLRLPMPGDVPLQMVAVKDIGVAAARVLLDPDSVEGEALELGGDELTLTQVAERAGAMLGREARFEEIPLEALDDDADLQAMFRWFATVPAYQADFDATRRIVPEVSDLRSWLRAQRHG